MADRRCVWGRRRTAAKITIGDPLHLVMAAHAATYDCSNGNNGIG
jgi:hypothetical protein